MSPLQTFITTAGMALIVFACRSIFMMAREEWAMPAWLRKAFHYAPVAALSAIVAPEVVMTQGHLIETWRDPRLFGALAGLAVYAWRRSLLGAIVCGTGVMAAMRFALG